jgi:hypothetical protein
VAVLRSAPYSCGSSLGNAAVRSAWVPLFSRYGVRLVVGGDGNYQRFGVGRTTYVVTGATAAGSRPCPRSHPRRRVTRPTQSFVYLTADPSGLTVRAADLAGRTIDRFRVR